MLFRSFGPVQASRRRRFPQPLSPTFSRRNQAKSAGLCPAPGFDLLPCAAYPLSFVFHFPFWTAPRKRTQKRTSQKARSVSGDRRAAGESRARIVVSIFHNSNYSRKNRQWVAILFFGKFESKNRFIRRKLISQPVKCLVADIPTLPGAVI